MRLLGADNETVLRWFILCAAPRPGRGAVALGSYADTGVSAKVQGGVQVGRRARRTRRVETIRERLKRL